jgi:RNA polymerase sigma factor (sigma-70 family)
MQQTPMTARSTEATSLDIDLALQGQGDALERVLREVEPQAFGLAIRMLGNREDALDATQEILIRIATRLSGFKGDSSFSTWTYRVAANALIDFRRAQKRSRERSFSELAQGLESGLEAFDNLANASSAVTPEDHAVASEMALMCTQGMLMALDRPHRLAYILGEVFDLSSQQAADTAGLTPAAFRQQLSRARRDLRGFMTRTCGLVHADAPCRCEKQVAALPSQTAQVLRRMPLSDGAPSPILRNAESRAGLSELAQLRRVARVFRAHPAYAADQDVVAGIRARIAATVFGRA